MQTKTLIFIAAVLPSLALGSPVNRRDATVGVPGTTTALTVATPNIPPTTSTKPGGQGGAPAPNTQPTVATPPVPTAPTNPVAPPNPTTPSTVTNPAAPGTVSCTNSAPGIVPPNSGDCQKVINGINSGDKQGQIVNFSVGTCTLQYTANNEVSTDGTTLQAEAQVAMNAIAVACGNIMGKYTDANGVYAYYTTSTP